MKLPARIAPRWSVKNAVISSGGSSAFGGAPGEREADDQQDHRNDSGRRVGAPSSLIGHCGESSPPRRTDSAAERLDHVLRVGHGQTVALELDRRAAGLVNQL